MRLGPGKNFDVGISSAKGRSSYGRPTVFISTTCINLFIIYSKIICLYLFKDYLSISIQRLFVYQFIYSIIYLSFLSTYCSIYVFVTCQAKSDHLRFDYFRLSSLPVAHLSDAPRRRLVVTGDSARIQDKTTENSAWFFNVLGV